MGHVDGKHFSITYREEKDREAAELALKVAEREWPKYERRYMAEFSDLFLREVVHGLPVTDEDMKAAARRVVGS